MWGVVRSLIELYGSTAAREFGPRALKAVREHLLQSGRYCRGEINKWTNRIRRIFKWAVSEELVPVEVWQALKSVEGLRRGRTTAREGCLTAALDALYEAKPPVTTRSLARSFRLVEGSMLPMLRGVEQASLVQSVNGRGGVPLQT